MHRTCWLDRFRLAASRALGWTALPLMLLTLLAGPVSAVEIQPGQVYAGGTSLTASDVGVTMRVPDGWQAALPVGGSALAMERSDQRAFIFAVADRTTEAEVRAEMAQPIDLGDGIVLQPKASPSSEGKGLLRGDYQVFGAPSPGEGTVWARLADTGIGVAFFAIDLGGDGGASREAERLARGVSFAKPVIPDPTGGEGNADWQSYMRGRYIARFYTGSGYHEKTELWLCSDGRFSRSGEGGGFGGGASGAFQGGGSGRWSASGKQPGAGELRLEYADGVATYRLTLEGRSLYLDGTKWLRGDNEYCP